jgi:hypothetical protein
MAAERSSSKATSILQTTPDASLLDAIVTEGRLGQTREEQSKIP